MSKKRFKQERQNLEWIKNRIQNKLSCDSDYEEIIILEMLRDEIRHKKLIETGIYIPK